MDDDEEEGDDKEEAPLEVSKFLAGSFSAVSKRNFARKYAFDSIFKLYKMCTLLHRSKLNVLATHVKNPLKKQFS